MATLNEQLTELQTARDNMKTALTGKGQAVTNDIRTYAEAIAGISGGSSEPVEGVKIFNSIEEMNNSTGNNEGDLALVYRTELLPGKNHTTFETIILDDTITFDTAITGSSTAYLTGGGVSYQAGLSPVQFNIRDNSNYSTIVRYSSTDGIVYTKNLGDNTYTFSAPVKVYGSAWDDNIGLFMKCEQNLLDGLFECKNISTDDTVQLEYQLAETQLDVTSDYVFGKTFYGINGVETGTLGSIVSNTINDVSAELYLKTQMIYDSMPIQIATDTYKNANNVFNRAYTIPVTSDLRPLLDTSNVTNGGSMFSYYSSLKFMPRIDTSNMINVERMFAGCSNLETIAYINLNNSVTSTYGMFASCSNLKYIPTLTTSNITNMSNMFQYCNELINIPSMDMSKVTNTCNMFNRCNNITSIPNLNLSKVTNAREMFQGCISLTHVPSLNISSVINGYGMFRQCYNLTSVETLNMNGTKSVNFMFNGCNNLVNMSVQNIATLNGAAKMFNACPNLSDDSLNNILATCITGTSCPNKTLNNIGLSQDQANRCMNLSNYAAFTAAGWTTGY